MRVPVKSRANLAVAVRIPTLVALALVVIACEGEPAGPPTPAAAGTIAFGSPAGMAGTTGADICIVNADCTGLKTLTASPGSEKDTSSTWNERPCWSPDGGRIVYCVYNSATDSASVWGMDADGSSHRQLSQEDGFGPSWSTDGRYIVYDHVASESDEPSQIDVLVMNADGSGTRTLVTNIQEEPSGPSWTPDGKVLFLREGTLYSISLDGSEETRLTTGMNVCQYALSPDGKTLAYCLIPAGMAWADPDYKAGIFAVSLEGGSTPVALIEDVEPLIGEEPLVAFSWTSDGKALVVAANHHNAQGGSPLFVANTDGTGLSQVPGIDAAFDPSWRPK